MHSSRAVYGGLQASRLHPHLGARSSRAARALFRRAARQDSARASCAMVVDLEGATAAGVAIRPSPGKGMGAFTTRARAAGELVGDYVGECMNAREKDARYLGIGERTMADLDWIRSRRERGVSISGDYILGVGNDIYIDAEDPLHSNWCRYLNHDSAPNVALKTLPRGIGGKPRAWFVTLRAIPPDTELCFDYGDEYWHDAAPVSSAS